LLCNNGVSGERHCVEEFSMSDNLAAQTQSAMPRTNADDTRVLAQVEKWMALIREIKRERGTN
jgi:hypothetical protein